MTVFITGATGYIGHAVASTFRRAGYRVFGLTRTEKGARLLQQSEIHPFIGTVAEPETFLPAAQNADILIHCAVEYSDKTALRDMQAIDALLTAACHTSSSKTFLYTSGVWIYGNTGNRNTDEETPLNPIPKISWRPEHEEKVLKANSSSLKTIVLRPGCVYGGSGGVMPLWYGPAAKKKPIPFIEDGENHWAMVHRDDLANGYLLAVEKMIPSMALNLTDDSHCTTRQLTEAIATVTQGQAASMSKEEAFAAYGSLVEGLALDQKISSEKAKSLLGWRAVQPDCVQGAALYFDAWKAARNS